ITKVFTSLALADMVEEGLVRIDDPVRLHLPDEVKVPRSGDREITLRHLSTHTSGLPRVPGKLILRGLISDNPYADFGAKDLYDFLAKARLAHAPGERDEYSNVGAGLLGHALARRAGLDYERLIVSRICDPLGMDDTRIALSSGQRDRLAKPYTRALTPAKNW